MQNSRLVLFLAIVVATVILVIPAVALLLNFTVPSNVTVDVDSLAVVLRTFGWAFSIGILATAIGWPLGLSVSTFSPKMRRFVLTVLLMTLVIPSYAIFYSWWQVWPAGSLIHDFMVKHELLLFATKTTLALSLVGWSWPIAALISATCSSKNDSLHVLHRIDGVSMCRIILNHLHSHLSLLISSCVLIAAITAANTTSFDLSQLGTIGNELRAVIAAGGSVHDVPILGWSSLVFACFAAVVLFRMRTQVKRTAISKSRKTAVPIIVFWIVFSGGPIIIGALHATTVDSFLLFSQYGGDVVRSLTTALLTALGCFMILILSATLHASVSSRVRLFASCLDVLWVCAALVPATIIVDGEILAWNRPILDALYLSPFLLVFAQIAHFGFLGSLAGRWISSSSSVRTLLVSDASNSFFVFYSAIRDRIVLATLVLFAIVIAMSMSEVAMTTQLSSPASDQPIAIALLNAMHYQRPQIVTSVMLLFVVSAITAGCIVAIGFRRASLLLVFTLLLNCGQNSLPHSSEIQVPISIIGGTGKADGRFVTPRAVDYNNEVIVVIDKTGRLQRFDQNGTFLSSFSIPPTGNGFPTGVTIDNDDNIWIADTHGHRIRVLDKTGKELLIFGEYGTGDGQFLYPTDIAFGAGGLVFVSEYGGNDRISVFDHDGNFLYAFGSHGKGPCEFRRPQTIAIHPETKLLYITDSANHRIVVYDFDGKLVHTFGTVGNERGKLLYPYSIIVLEDNTLLVTEFGNNRLQQFNTNGESLGIWGKAGDSEGSFKTPWGAVRVQGGVLVIDTGNNRLQLLNGFMM